MIRSQSRTTTFAHSMPAAGTLVRQSYRLALPSRMWLYVAACLAAVAAMAFLHLTQASYVAAQVEHMESLERGLLEIKQHNNALRLQIAEYEQAARIKQRAAALGFREPERVEYVTVTVPASYTSMKGSAWDPSQAMSSPSSQLPPWWIAAVGQLSAWNQPPVLAPANTGP